MSKILSYSVKTKWKRTLSLLLVLLTVLGMLPSTALAAEWSPNYAATGDFEVNIAGATGWNAFPQSLSVYDSETDGSQTATIPAAGEDAPIAFVILEDNGGDRVKIGLAPNGVSWEGGSVSKTGWVDKESIFVNLPDVLPSIAYTKLPAEQFSSRLCRYEFIVPCWYTLAEYLAKAQKEAMTNGETLLVYAAGNETAGINLAKGDLGDLHDYEIDGAEYQKYETWTDTGLSAYPEEWNKPFSIPANITRSYSTRPYTTFTEVCAKSGARRAPARASSNPTGGTGGLNPGSPGGQKPTSSTVAWTTDQERTFLRFTLVEFPEGVVTDLNTTDYSTWHVVGHPLNVVWGKGKIETWDAAQCRSRITWFNSNALQFNGKGNNAPDLMGSTVYAYDATAGTNARWVTTADEFQAESGITDQQKEQMFHCNSSNWSTGWKDGDYTSMWGTDPESVTPGNPYKVYKANDAFIYLLGRLSETGGAGSGWSKDTAIEKWSEYIHDKNGNLRTKYRIIVETGGVVVDPDGNRRAYTLREMMGYSLYNNEPAAINHLIYDQSSTIKNMSRWMRQSKDSQFLEYPLNSDGTPTGEELHSTNGFAEADSFVDSLNSPTKIRSTIFSERRSYGLHIFSPFNFESPKPPPDKVSLEVTKNASEALADDGSWGFTVTYTEGSPTSFSAKKGDTDCTSEVTDTGSGLKFTLKAGETIHIDFDADASFRFEVSEDDPANLTDITGTGGTADTEDNKFTSSGGESKVTFTNGDAPPPPPDDDDPPPETPPSGPSGPIVYKRDAMTNKGVGPATFKFSSVVNGVYEFTTDANGELEPIQWWNPTDESEGRYIKPGEYAVTEIVPPPNYMPTTEVQQIKLELDDKGNGIPAGPLVFKNLAKTGLRILKYDRQSHAPMAGVSFEIFKDGVSIGRYETNGSGEILLTGIEPGTYRAVEVDTGDDGHILDTSWQEVELIAGEGVKDLMFFNDKKPGMKLVKVDSSDPSKTIPGVKFSIRAIDGSYGPQEFVTDSNGEIDLSKLPEGSYEVTELECPGYVIDNAQRIIHLHPNDTAQFVFTNTRKPSLRLIKTSADGTPLDGVTFKITPIEDASHSIDRTTQNGGEILVEGLEPGIYSVQETATLPDHILDKKEYHVELSPGKTSEIRLKNDKRPSLTIWKRDANTKEIIPNTIFLVKAADGHSVNEVKTGPDGKGTLENLLPGVYEISEKSVPEPWLKDAANQLVTLYPNKDREVVFENHKKPLLTLSKIDADTGVPVPGTVFTVKGIDNDYQDDWTTGADGRAAKRVPPGTYQVTEKSVPSPYFLPDKDADRVQTITLNGGDEKGLLFKNHKAPELTIYKEDSVAGVPIEGTKFHITYTSNGESADAPASIDFGFFLTDANGEIKLHEKGKKLYPGEYTISEVEPAPGFQMKEPTTQRVILRGGESKTVTFQNEPLNAIVVEKYDSVTHEALPGCTFQLRFLGGTSGTGGTVIGTKVTGKNGTCIWTGLTAGTYIIEEVNPADGYSIIKSSETVYISDDGKQNVVTVKFDNAPDGILLIRKVCAVNPSITLQDAEFKVIYADGTVIGDSNGIYRTDENGEIRIEGLKPGKSVVVTETRAPDGFIIDTQSQTVQIKEGRTVSLTFKNQPKGSLIIQKRDSISGQPLPGAQFRLTTAAGCEVGLDGVIGTSALTQNGLFTTDSNGEIRVSNLAPGALVLTEVKAPAGYVMDAPSTNVVIGANGDTQTVIITNTPKGGLVVEKYDSVTKQPLAGARFKITNANGELVPDNEGLTSSNGMYTTDRNGQIVLSKVQPGTYVVVEDKEPDFYRKDPTPQTVVVAAGDTQTLRFYNDPLCTLTILKRDAVTKKPLAKAEFLVRDSEGKAIGPNNGRYITGTDGTVTVTGLEPNATIVVSESKAPTGYIKDETPKNIVVRTGVANSLIFDNEPATTLIIQKFIEGTENEPLSGVAFKVTDGAGAAVGPDDGTYYTDKAGEIVLSGLEPGTTVKAREIKTVEGFVLDGTPQDILIKAGEVQRLTFWNKRDNSLTILKQSTDKTPLTGAVFHVTDEDGAAIGTNNGRYTSDRNGLITITGLQPGQILIVTEEKAPNGYVRDMTPKTIKIKQGVANSLIFENAHAGSLVINKRSSVDKKTPLEGVTFKITTTSGEFLPDESGKISSNGLYYTDENGQIIINGIVGTLVVTEQATIPGYTISEANRSQTVEVKPDDTQTLYFYNDPLCSLTITKLDSVTGKPVPNTEFTLKDGNGNILGKYTTGKDGTVTVGGLVPGTAVVVTETRVPSGYVLNQIPQTIIVKNGTSNLTSGAGSNSGGSSGSTGWSSNGNDLTFENDPKTTLTIEKYLETETGNQPLKGVTFLVTDSSGAVIGPDNGEYITGEDGRIVIKNLEPGATITAKEIKVPEGVLLDTLPKSIQIKTGEGQTLRFVNKKAGTLVVRKLDKVSKAPLAGVEFEITYAEGGFVDDANGHLSSKGRYKTNDMGEIRLTVTGTVVVKEVTPCPGYVIDTTTQIQTVKVNPADTQTLVFYNEPLCSLTLTKRDSVTGKPIPGTEFTLKDGNGNVLGKYTTGQDGTVTVTGLVPGSTVVAVETKVPSGYVLDSTPKTIIVKNGTGNSIINGGSTGSSSGNTGTSNPGISSGNGNSLDFENDPKMTLTIHKYISGTANEPLAGVAFKVVDGSGTPLNPNGGIYYTNNAGEIVLDGLEPGTTITAQEIKTVDGFVLDGVPQTIKIEAGKAQNMTFWNKRAGTLVIQKLDKLTNKPLAGVEFQVTDANGNYVPDENGHISSNGLYRTDANGEIRIKGVVGTLVVKETKTIPGYSIDETARTQTVTVDPEDVQTLTFYNIPDSTLVIEKYVEGTNEPMKGVTFLVTDSSGAFVGKTNGEYTTDENGRIEITGLTPGETITAKETKTLEGFILDNQPKSVKITEGEAHTLKFYNKRQGTLVIRKLDKLTKAPLAGVEFELTYAEGGYVDDANGHLSSKGLYTTDANGEIRISGISGTIVVKETKTIPGYSIDPGTQSQTVTVNSADTQTITFYNTPGTTLTIQKYVDGTTEPIQGVTFLITDSAGTPLGNNQGEYVTDRNGRIVLNSLTPGTTIIAKEVRTADGFVLDGQPQSILIKEGDAQQLTFYNKAFGGVEIIKVDAADKTKRLANVTFEIRRMDGGLVETVTTGADGRVELDLDAGDYYALETEAAEGYKLDGTPHYFTVVDGKPTSVTITNAAFSGIIIHKVNSVTGEGIYDVKFLVYDQNKNPIGEYSTDNEGYIYIDDLTVQGKGKLFIRELEAAPGYELDKEYKTVYVQPGKTIEIEWKNVPITGQFQVYKYAAEYNEVTGTPAGAPLKGAVYEISEVRSGKVVDYITTDARGVAASKPLPLGRYKIVEVTPPAYWKLSGTAFDETLEYSGQIIKVSDYDKPSNLGVTITKRGNAEVLAGSQMRYDFTVANTSNVPLDNFFWHDRIPTDAATAMMLTTGTYSARLNYRILYKTSSGGDYQVLASNLTSTSSYAFNLNAIPTQAGEKVTEIYFDFGKVPVGFQSVASPTLSVVVSGNVANGYQLMNRADAGGKYQGAWQTAQGYWVTIVRKLDTPSPKLPKTGY